MFAKKFTLVVAVASMALGPLTVRAEDNDALLNLLVKKHIITEKEAGEVRTELAKTTAKEAEAPAVPMSSASSATKLKLSTPLTELEIYGDARVRYEVRSGETASPDTINSHGDTYQRNRARYRLRLGLRGTLVDDWFFGVRLETSTNPRSTNVTFGDDTATGPGPFAKNSDSIGVGQAYLGYKGIRNLTLTAGKMANPFITTSMVWDPDINPEGLAEQYKYTIKFAGSTSAAPTTMDKDGKGIVPQTETVAGPTLDLFANFGQFVYDDTNPENPIGPSPNGVPKTDAFLLGWQVGARYNWNKNMYVQVAPTLYNYTGTGDTFYTHFVGDPTFIDGNGNKVTPNQTGVNSLLVIELPAEFGFKLSKLPARIFGDFAVNADGGARARAAGHPDQTDQKFAYQIGAGIGSTKHRGDFSVTAFWQHAEQFSLDPNLVDSDIFDSRVNIEGVFVQLGYALSDAVTANFTYAHGWQINSSLGTGGVGDLGINPVNNYNLFQTDLSFKF
ncbi:MAG: putative porin [Chthoniobacterales bacterium]